MIDDLMSQNRALDGDTVIISLLDPLYWVSYKTNNIVISKSGKQKNIVTGYTNETAIETRIIDEQIGGKHQEIDQSHDNKFKEELKSSLAGEK